MKSRAAASRLQQTCWLSDVSALARFALDASSHTNRLQIRLVTAALQCVVLQSGHHLKESLESGDAKKARIYPLRRPNGHLPNLRLTLKSPHRLPARNGGRSPLLQSNSETLCCAASRISRKLRTVRVVWALLHMICFAWDIDPAEGQQKSREHTMRFRA